MKYFICSDIHGCYKKLRCSLDIAGYDKNNKNHTLVILGDLFDRGSQNIEVFNFIQSLNKERLVLVRGNHEDCLIELINRGYLLDRDSYNGTEQTVINFLDHSNYSSSTYDNWAEYFKKLPIWKFLNDKKIWRNYFELGDYIMVHGWLPFLYDYNDDDHLILDPNWPSDDANWYKAVWSKGVDSYNYKYNKLYPENKIIICGHTPTPLIRHCSISEDTSIYRDGDLVVIDGGAVFGGILNVLIIDDKDMKMFDQFKKEIKN